MTTTVASPHTDLPIIVQDRRRRGFYKIDNEIIDRYGLVLKAHGVAVYSVLARFANREGECFPSQATIAKRLGMSRMQVIREIDKLKALGLIEVKPQFGSHGEQRSNLYILCDVPKVESVQHRYTPCHSELHPPVTTSDTGCNRPLPKQNTAKKIQTEQDLKQPVVVALGSDSPNLLNEQGIENTEPVRESHDDNDLSAALLARGLAKPVVQQLMLHYSQAYLAEKLAYLSYLQDTQPEKVLKPCGWLRKAIENDYAAPDGYTTAAAQAGASLEVHYVEEVLQQEYEEQQQRNDEKRTQQAQAAAARLTTLQATYGATEREWNVWAQILEEFRSTLPAATFTRHFADSRLLVAKDGEAIIGLPTLVGGEWLANRFGQKLAYALAARLGEQPYTVKFIDLSLLSTQPAVA